MSVELSPEDKEWIFRRIVWPDYRDDVVSQDHPVVVYVMAQPGAGKSENRHLVDQGSGKATRIAGDDFKIAHPAYLMLLADDPRTAGERIRHIYQEWQGRVEGLVRGRHGDMVIEISPDRTEKFLADVAAFRAEGYRVELVVLAVRKSDSWQSLGLRYADALARNDRCARFTSAHGHHKCCEVLTEVVEAVERESAVDLLSVVRRDGTVLHRSERDAAGRLERGAVEALREEWRRLYTPEEAALFEANQERLRENLPAYGDEWDQIAEQAEPLMPSAN